jgi:hypothetical protein
MSTDERTTVPAWRRYRVPLSLPADPSDEELARDWTLSAADKVKIQGCTRRTSPYSYRAMPTVPSPSSTRTLPR